MLKVRKSILVGKVGLHKMYHFAWVDQREKGYKSDVPGLQLVIPGKINL